MLLPGQKAIVCVPEPIPAPYCDYHPHWIEYIKSLNDQTVTLEVEHLMASTLTIRETGWKISYHIKPADFATLPWVPTPWLVGVGQSPPTTIPCDCSINMLLQSGCQNSLHE